MKKLGLVFMPLFAVSLLTDCGNKPTKTVTFSVESVEAYEKEANINLNWTPSDHSVKFLSAEFVPSGSVKVTKTELLGKETDRPFPIKVTFENEITESVSGKLKFNYEDLTAKVTDSAELPMGISPSYNASRIKSVEVSDGLSLMSQEIDKTNSNNVLKRINKNEGIDTGNGLVKQKEEGFEPVPFEDKDGEEVKEFQVTWTRYLGDGYIYVSGAYPDYSGYERFIVNTRTNETISEPGWQVNQQIEFNYYEGPLSRKNFYKDKDDNFYFVGLHAFNPFSLDNPDSAYGIGVYDKNLKLLKRYESPDGYDMVGKIGDFWIYRFNLWFAVNSEGEAVIQGCKNEYGPETGFPTKTNELKLQHFDNEGNVTLYDLPYEVKSLEKDFSHDLVFVGPDNKFYFFQRQLWSEPDPVTSETYMIRSPILYQLDFSNPTNIYKKIWATAEEESIKDDGMQLGKNMFTYENKIIFPLMNGFFNEPKNVFLTLDFNNGSPSISITRLDGYSISYGMAQSDNLVYCNVETVDDTGRIFSIYSLDLEDLTKMPVKIFTITNHYELGKLSVSPDKSALTGVSVNDQASLAYDLNSGITEVEATPLGELSNWEYIPL